MRRGTWRAAAAAVALLLLGPAGCETASAAPGTPGPCEHLRTRRLADEPLCRELAQVALEDAAGHERDAASRLAAVDPDGAPRPALSALIALMRARMARDAGVTADAYAQAFEAAERAGELEVAALAAAEAIMALGPGRRADAEAWAARLEATAADESLAPAAASVVAAARGRVASDAGRTEEGLEWLRDALAHAEVAFGPDSPETAAAALNLGLGAKKAGDPEGAREAYDRAIRLLQDHRGHHRGRLAGAFAKRGTLQLSLRDFDGARADLERARAEYSALRGPAHPDVAGVIVDLGLTDARDGELGAAIAHYDEAIGILQAATPADPVLAMALINRAAAWRKLDRLEAATDDDLSALAILEAAGRGDSFEAAGARINLAAIRVLQGRPGNALDALERALASLEAAGRGDSLAAAVAYVNRCEAHLALAALDEARGACERAVEIRRETLAADDPRLAAAQEVLAKVERARGGAQPEDGR